MEELQGQTQELPGTSLLPTALQSCLPAAAVATAHGFHACPGQRHQGRSPLALSCGVLGGSTRHLGDGWQAGARADPEGRPGHNDGLS